jgi:diphthamide synthase (EF-2-diphthine--ammonia ligase)
MERKELEAQYRLERDINAGANASNYHKKRFAELSKEMGIANSTPKVEAKTETVVQTTQSTATEETTVVSTDEAPDEEPKKKQG